MRDAPLWTPLGAFALAAAWLLPNASPPWLAFHKDAWFATCLAVVAVVRVVRARKGDVPFRADPVVAILVAMVCMAAWQRWAGILQFDGQLAMAVGYLGAAALAIVIGRQWAESEGAAFADFLFLALTVAALGSSGLILVQWLQLDWMGVWIQEVSARGRPYGNLNQPNNAATLLVLGMVSLCWWAWRGRLRCSIWWLTMSYLVLVLAMTGSRIGYLSLVSLVLLGLVVTWRHGVPARWRVGALALLAVLPLGIWMVTADWGGAQALQTVDSVKVFERDLTTARRRVWLAYLHAAWANPWQGYGFEQGVLTQLAASRLGYELNALYTWSHNALIDVAAWFGLPLAGACVVVVFWLLWVVLRAPWSATRCLYLAAIFPVVLHGMVELPLAFAYFLLPVCLLTGALVSTLPWQGMRLPRLLVASWALALSGLLAVIVHDYFRIESAFYTWRFEQANIGTNHPMDVPETLVLDQMEALLVGLRGRADSLTREQVDRFEQAIVHDPSMAALQHLARMRVLQGDLQGAQRAADWAHTIAKPRARRATAANWRYYMLEDASFEAVEWKE
jgi:hypothetical protein